MPSAIAGVFLALGANAGVALIAAEFVASYGLLVGGLALSAYQARRAKQKARAQFNASQVDRLVNVSSTVSDREMALGRVRKGGTVFFRASTGANKTKFVMCIALAGHEIDGVEQIYFNDEPVTVDPANGNVTSNPYALATPTSGAATADASGQATLPYTPLGGTVVAYTGTTGGRDGDLAQVLATVVGNVVTTEPFAAINYQYNVASSRANVRWYLGADSQAADARLMTLFPTMWTAAHRARGVAYLICEFDYNETAFPTSLPTVTALIRGAKVYDPRTGSTAWSDNPALLMRHVYAHPQFGKAAVTAAEDVRIGAVATACDASHGYVVDGVTTTVALYRAGMVLPFGAAAKDALDDLTAAMAGSWAFAGGELYLRAGVFSSSVMSLVDADLVGIVRDGASEQDRPLSISPHRERVQKFNVVNLQIWDAAQAYKQVALTPLKSSALITRDGAELAQSITLAAVGYAPQAQHIAGVMMRDARDPLTVTLQFKMRAYPLELFDTIDLTIARYGWSAKLFQVVGRDWSSDGNLAITLKETAAAHYTPDGTFAAQGYALNTGLPSPWYVPTVGALTVTSGTAELLKLADGSIVSRMRVSWPTIDDASVTEAGSIEVQYREVLSSGEWSREEVSGNETQVVIAGVQDLNAYIIRARARNRIAVGLWSLQVSHLVIGQTEAPLPFDRFIVLAQPDGTRQINFGYTGLPPVDWLGAQIRYLAGTHVSPDWDAMAVLSDEATYYTASPVEVNAPTAGTFTFACRSIDRSGNLSAYLLDTITLPARRLGSVFDEFYEHAEGWLGTKTSCAVDVDGFLQANDATTWATLPATWTGWTQWNNSPASPITYITPVRDLGLVISGLIGVTLDADGSEAVELATSDDNVTWSSWGSVSASFTARYLKLRLTLTATGPDPIPLVRSWYWYIDSPLQREYINDLVISGLTGSYRIGTGDIRVPLSISLAVIKRISVTIQDSGAGSWTYQRIDQVLTYGPRYQFRFNGVLADPAFVDFFVEGY